MFGKNLVHGPDLSNPEALVIKSIFDTIQGEGPFCGVPATFIRFGLCHLKCYFCDTDFSEPLQMYTPEQLKNKCNHRLVVLTGGEPLRQNVIPLVHSLLLCGFVVQIETAGNLPFLFPRYIDYRRDQIFVVCSPKTDKVDPSVTSYNTCYKYIISARDFLSPTDGLPLSSTQQQGMGKRLFRPSNLDSLVRQRKIYIQPQDDYDDVLNECNRNKCVELALKFGYRISLQQHKLLGVE